jgi:anaerobic magnesium-protoporphyrin IX monomethyl ester cyclase
MACDVTLINVNLMFAVIDGAVDFQAYAPLGLLYIAACLEREGYSVDFRDYQLFVKQNTQDPFNLEGFSQFMTGASNIVGFSCMSNLLPFTLLAAKRVKEENPDTVVVLGGVGPTGVAREIVENFYWIDYVCSGEGERSMVDLVTWLLEARGSGADGPVPGFFCRQGGDVMYVPRSRIEDLDALPLPAYHLIDSEAYDAAFSVVTSRGCPYRCAFCTETNHWNNREVFRSVESVIEEVAYISERSAKRVFLFQDDQITLDRDRARHLFQRLIAQDFGMYWKCFARVDLVDRELLALMAKAGCIQVRFGVESGSNRVLDRIHKGFTIEEAYQAIRLALDYIPSVHASFIWGYPFETVQECQETIAWIRRFQDAGCTTLNFLLSPLPNSEIYRDYDGPLDFNENIMANFNNSGAENITQAGTCALENATYMFEFIRQYPRLFPGFYLYDYENNVKPKMRIVHEDRRLVFRGMKDVRVGDYDLVDL